MIFSIAEYFSFATVWVWRSICRKLLRATYSRSILLWRGFIYEEISGCDVNISGISSSHLSAKGGLVPPSLHILPCWYEDKIYTQKASSIQCKGHRYGNFVDFPFNSLCLSRWAITGRVRVLTALFPTAPQQTWSTRHTPSSTQAHDLQFLCISIIFVFPLRYHCSSSAAPQIPLFPNPTQKWSDNGATVKFLYVLKCCVPII